MLEPVSEKYYCVRNWKAKWVHCFWCLYRNKAFGTSVTFLFRKIKADGGKMKRMGRWLYLPNFTTSDFVPSYATGEPRGNQEEVRLTLTGDPGKASERLLVSWAWKEMSDLNCSTWGTAVQVEKIGCVREWWVWQEVTMIRMDIVRYFMSVSLTEIKGPWGQSPGLVSKTKPLPNFLKPAPSANVPRP